LANRVNLILGISLLTLRVSAFTLTLKLSQAHTSVYLAWEVLFIGESLTFPVLVDRFSAGFVFTVRVIAGSIYFFSHGYMAAEKFFLRFHLLVLSFVASIMLLILSPNVVRVLLG